MNLGVIVYLLSASAQLFMTTLESHKQLYHKYLNVADMSTEVLKEVGCTDYNTEEFLENQKKKLTLVIDIRWLV